MAKFQADSGVDLPEMERDLADLREHIEQVKSMKESLKQAGQPWQPERQLKIVTKFHQEMIINLSIKLFYVWFYKSCQAQNAVRSATQKQSQLDEMRKEFDEIFTSADEALNSIIPPEPCSGDKLIENELLQKMACCHVTIGQVLHS